GKGERLDRLEEGTGKDEGRGGNTCRKGLDLGDQVFGEKVLVHSTTVARTRWWNSRSLVVRFMGTILDLMTEVASVSSGGRGRGGTNGSGCSLEPSTVRRPSSLGTGSSHQRQYQHQYPAFSLKHTEHLFSIVLEFASLGAEEKALLIRLGAIPRVIHAALGEANSPVPPSFLFPEVGPLPLPLPLPVILPLSWRENASPPGKECSTRWCTATGAFLPIVNLVSVLVRSCIMVSPAAWQEIKDVPPHDDLQACETLLELPRSTFGACLPPGLLIPSGSGQHMVVLPQFESELLRHPQVLDLVMTGRLPLPSHSANMSRTEQQLISLIRLTKHFCWDNMVHTKYMVDHCTYMVANGQINTFYMHLRVLLALLGITDRIQQQRVEVVMSGLVSAVMDNLDYKKEGMEILSMVMGCVAGLWQDLVPERCVMPMRVWMFQHLNDWMDKLVLVPGVARELRHAASTCIQATVPEVWRYKAGEQLADNNMTVNSIGGTWKLSPASSQSPRTGSVSEGEGANVEVGTGAVAGTSGWQNVEQDIVAIQDMGQSPEKWRKGLGLGLGLGGGERKGARPGPGGAGPGTGLPEEQEALQENKGAEVIGVIPNNRLGVETEKTSALFKTKSTKSALTKSVTTPGASPTPARDGVASPGDGSKPQPEKVTAGVGDKGSNAENSANSAVDGNTVTGDWQSPSSVTVAMDNDVTVDTESRGYAERRINNGHESEGAMTETEQQEQLNIDEGGLTETASVHLGWLFRSLLCQVPKVYNLIRESNNGQDLPELFELLRFCVVGNKGEDTIFCEMQEIFMQTFWNFDRLRRDEDVTKGEMLYFLFTLFERHPQLYAIFLEDNIAQAMMEAHISFRNTVVNAQYNDRYGVLYYRLIINTSQRYPEFLDRLANAHNWKWCIEWFLLKSNRLGKLTETLLEGLHLCFQRYPGSYAERVVGWMTQKERFIKVVNGEPPLNVLRVLAAALQPAPSQALQSKDYDCVFLHFILNGCIQQLTEVFRDICEKDWTQVHLPHPSMVSTAKILCVEIYLTVDAWLSKKIQCPMGLWPPWQHPPGGGTLSNPSKGHEHNLGQCTGNAGTAGSNNNQATGALKAQHPEGAVSPVVMYR
ncbi:unnamed protein product, partial [Discosporangium mesarthrocarpum]